MKALLIYPPFPASFFGFRHALELTGKKAISPPLGLLTVGALLPREWDLRLVDMNVRALTDDDIAWAEIAFVSVMAIQRAAAQAVITRCRAASVRTVIGGALPTSDPRADVAADHVVRNEAELTLPDFLHDLEHGTAQPVYASEEFCHLASAPLPRWDLVDMSAYALMDVQCTRGCPYACDFCNAAVIGGARHRLKPAEKVIAELDALAELGWRGEVFLVDDNLTATPTYLKERLLPALIERRRSGARMPFHIQAGVDLADDFELRAMLFEAGVNQIFVGIESLDETCLEECHKRQNRGRDLVADVRVLQRDGFSVMAGFIVGFDHDTTETFARHARFIESSGVVLPVVSVLLAPPGTRLRRRIEAEGRIDPRGEDGADGITNIIPRMGRDALEQGYQWLVQHVYEPRAFYQRARRFLHTAQRVPATPASRLQDVAVVPRIVWYLGVVDDARGTFWRFLVWALVHRPRMFWFAMVFAVCGYHCRRHYTRWSPRDS